ncbi:MAG: hypothetical protein COT36_04880 [Parcubacteria group bacterium CG08_land_8_20_14_0_20_38_56]|nr:MAG: hypothetical protein COT36_04880 [Parcubacteria group bacterium CG08_land_8_20_14_0_20_38_56]
MIDREIIKNKIRDILLYLKEIEPFLKLSPSEIIKDYTKLRTLERNFQLIVDSMVDINMHIISQKNLVPPDDYQSTFSILGENKIIPIDFALKIAPAAGTRNRIVHRYGDIDKKKFITDIQKGASDFKQYCRYIEKIVV